MKIYERCGFNAHKEVQSTWALIECGDACCQRDKLSHVDSGFEPWPDCNDCISALGLQQLLKLGKEQTKEEPGLRRTQVKYFNNLFDRWRSKRRSGQECESCSRSRCAGQKHDNESATRPTQRYSSKRSE